VNPGVLHLNGSYLQDTNAAVSALTIYSGGSVYMRDTISGDNSKYGVDGTAGSLYDLGGNSFVNGTNFTGTINSPANLAGSCTGVATSSSTLYLYGLGEVSASTCTVTALLGGQVMKQSGTLMGIKVTAGEAGKAAGSGAVTVIVNGSPIAITCTIGTTTGCTDFAHPTAYNVGDIVAVSCTTQSSETLGDIKAQVWAQF